MKYVNTVHPQGKQQSLSLLYTFCLRSTFRRTLILLKTEAKRMERCALGGKKVNDQAVGDFETSCAVKK